MNLLWKKFPNAKPKKRGWYQCTLEFAFDTTVFNETVYQGYVMDLFWEPETERFIDNRRQNVFDSYRIFCDATLAKNLHTDKLVDRTNEVTAWKKLPGMYKDPHKLYKEGKLNICL